MPLQLNNLFSHWLIELIESFILWTLLDKLDPFSSLVKETSYLRDVNVYRQTGA